MRAVWSFWSKPFRGEKGRSWQSPLHHLLAWGLSLRLARKHFPETMLVTDTPGKALLVDALGLSFTEVSTELDDFRHCDPGWWSLSKLVAYRAQTKPFIHLDTDVFLWKPLPAAMLAAPVFAQCPEDHPPLDTWWGPDPIERAFAELQLEFPRNGSGLVHARRISSVRQTAASWAPTASTSSSTSPASPSI